MRRTLRLGLFSTILLSSVAASGQNDRFAYAITDLTKEGSGWNALRKLDLRTGEYSTVLLNGTDLKTPVYDPTTKRPLTLPTDARYGNIMHAPFSTGVAAAAYDRKNNRLYYTPMFIDQLRYIDLKTMQVYYVTDKAFTGLGNMHNDEGKCITRMVITPDGTGYAISNDGNTFLRFSTGKKFEVVNLGGLVDDGDNGGVSIHNRCSSYGGDMIADDKGNLYIMSARNQVFMVNTETKVAKHLGGIKGLPGSFTVNGAAVDSDGNLLVSSAVDGKGYYVVNPKTWEASSIALNDVFRSSDLANSNYLSSRPKTTVIETIATVQPAYNKLIQVFPNPVTANHFTMQFNKVPVGEYTIELTDVMGRLVMQERISVKHEYATQNVSISNTKAKGIYLVKMLDAGRKAVFEQKLMIQ